MTRFLLLPALLFSMAIAAAAVSFEPVRAGGGCRGTPSTSAAGDKVQMSGTSCFTPTVLYAEPGATVTWTNDSTEPHDVAGATLEWGNYDEIRRGDSVSYRFDEPGTYPYYCFIHNGMIGAIVVGDGRFTAATQAANGLRAAARSPSGPAQNAPPAAGEPRSPGATDSVSAARGPVQASSSGSETLLVGALGALIGGVAVAAGFTARAMRRPRPGT